MIPTKPFLLSAAVLLGTAGPAAARPVAPPAFKLKVFAGAPSHGISAPDDITYLNGHVYVAWQNGVGTKGEPAAKTHTATSQLVEYAKSGRVVNSWSLAGKIDGIAGAPGLKAVVATANEDGNSHLFTIRPSARRSRQVHLYRYAPAPDSRGTSMVHTGGGTDAVTVLANGRILVSASAPSRRPATATFRVILHGTTAHLFPMFSDNAKATDALTGTSVKLHLTDPDSNALVPAGLGDPFGGQYVLDSQGDRQVIFAKGGALTREKLTYGDNSVPASIDDVRWAPADNSTLYVVDAKANTIYRVTGPFSADDALASMDTVGGKTFGGTVASFNDGDGSLTPFITGCKAAKGLLFIR
ncbi:MAG: hypothetical protein QOF83_442 [Solirubrobacteraceae bacterium]|jgi:hypothetical protein|nr:hypothetical protein [Solirubrobacteraceae bacterium]